MVRRRFSKPPSIGTGSRAPDRPEPGELPSQVKDFKQIYIYERRVLERFRGVSRPYKPSASLDGKSRWSSPEENKKAKNQWVESYNKLSSPQVPVEPIRYVRVLFRILRGSALSIPSVTQLASPRLVEIVKKYLDDHVTDIRQQFVAEGQRAHTSIILKHRGAGYSLTLSVYYAIVDERLGLSPLFKYCLAMSTVEKVKCKNDPDCELLRELAKQFELLAAMDYTLFPEEYDAVWGEEIPSHFRVAASGLLKTAIGQ